MVVSVLVIKCAGAIAVSFAVGICCMFSHGATVGSIAIVFVFVALVSIAFIAVTVVSIICHADACGRVMVVGVVAIMIDALLLLLLHLALLLFVLSWLSLSAVLHSFVALLLVPGSLSPGMCWSRAVITWSLLLSLVIFPCRGVVKLVVYSEGGALSEWRR